MKKANILTSGFLAAVMLLAANDKSYSQSNALAFNDASKPNSEAPVNNVPLIAEGTSGQAADISALRPSIVLFISGGKDPKYSAEDYAKMFSVMFKDPNRTDLPSEIYVRYQESGKDRQTAIKAFIGRKSFDKNGGEYKNGDGVFTPKEFVGYIDDVTEANAKANGIVSIKSADGQKVAFN